MEPGSAVSAVRSQRVLCGEEIRPAVILIKEGKIHSILPDSEASVHTAGKVLDVGNSLVMPGIVDCHVHVNEPGRTTWEGYWTATRAAAAGGVTTIVDMPLNSIPPTTTLGNFREKLRAATGQCFVDTAFWGGVIPDNQLELRPMVQAGVAGFKCFLIHSGVDEFPHVSDADLHAAMKQLQGTDSVLLFHAEREVQHPAAEKGAQPLELIRAARQAGAPLTVETTHHYLNLTAENIPARATQFKCCPPIRDTANQELLWSALKAGEIDMVVSDHSPCTPDLKCLDRGDFTQAWGGISSLQFGLSLFWTSASKRGFSFSDAVRLLCKEPAQLCRLDNQKGSLIPGHDADLVIWDPEKEFTLTPYLGLALRGKVKGTIVRGRVVYSHGSFSSQPLGKHLFIKHKTPAPL
ncbi:Allantoinase, mitochondrial [Anabarilius grahami]|uniref:Allantoinase, mitochondrial n=1 Tax=Anabarilius grahami TaxID=495550 RepID=A0A3N0XD05_ANAGA|nr:Allantoinase, mitochondrial [Anabarilius grahami]